LEKKVGNLYWSGDARMRYTASSSDEVADKYDGRIRLNVKGQVNDATYVQGQMVTQMMFKDADSAKPKTDGQTFMSQVYVNHNFGKNVAVRLGRQPIAFGNQGGWLYNALEGYDGAQVSYNNAKLSLTTGFGQLNDGWKDTDVYFAKGAYDFGFAKLNADYIADKDSEAQYRDEIYGVGLNIPVQKFNVFGEYWKNTTIGDYDTAWNAGLSYGKADWKKAGTWDLSVAYNDVDYGVYFGGGFWHNDMLKNFNTNYLGAYNLTFWTAIANVTLQKNVQLHAEYAFAADAEKSNNGADPDDSWSVSLNYKF
ncbi:MAG: S-layer protein, partial [Dialister sp.]|nr:S-layer protein [Dialister sp.]